MYESIDVHGSMNHSMVYAVIYWWKRGAGLPLEQHLLSSSIITSSYIHGHAGRHHASIFVCMYTSTQWHA